MTNKLAPLFKKQAKIALAGSAGGALAGVGVGALAGIAIAGFFEDDDEIDADGVLVPKTRTRTTGAGALSAGVGAATGAIVGGLVSVYAYRVGHRDAQEGISS